jgi:hypothetical protein
MERVFRILPFVWVILFSVTFFTESKIVEGLLLVVTVGYILELIFEYKRSESLRSFLRSHWMDILMVIPFFRLVKIGKTLKILRYGKKISQALRAAEGTVETIEISRRVKKSIRK